MLLHVLQILGGFVADATGGGLLQPIPLFYGVLQLGADLVVVHIAEIGPLHFAGGVAQGQLRKAQESVGVLGEEFDSQGVAVLAAAHLVVVVDAGVH